MTSGSKTSKVPGQTEARPIPVTPSALPIRLIRKVLVANRGEIACRVMRTCRAMGIATVAVYSDADAKARHVCEADEGVHLPGNAASDTYLNIAALLKAAERTGSDAVHPGYGFLSENAEFAAACREAGLIFIGPRTETITRMGSKIEAKRVAGSAGVPVVPGYSGEDQSDGRFFSESKVIGYPILVKASAGGGGKGMRVVESEALLVQALAAARREARSAFGDDALLLERYIAEPRHVEVQIFGDLYGNVVHLGERECSIQRRHQKLIEETPSTALDVDLRERMTHAAVAIGEQLHYDNAGTIEFILDASGNFYFLEVNTRLQVEHPVTELVTGFDLVAWQIRVAEGHSLPLAQSEIRFKGHAVEARLYAEIPAEDFLPASGPILLWREPSEEGVRVEGGVLSGETATPYYDPLLAKVVAYGEDRLTALRRLERALAKSVLFGIPSNREFLRRLLLHPDHVAGRISTAFIEQHRDELISPRVVGAEDELSARNVTIAAIAVVLKVFDVSGRTHHWRNNHGRPVIERFNFAGYSPITQQQDAESIEVRLMPTSSATFSVSCEIAGKMDSHEATLLEQHASDLVFELDGWRCHAVVAAGEGDVWWVAFNGEIVNLRRLSPFPAPISGRSALTTSERRNGEQASSERARPGMVVAPLPGLVVAVSVALGQVVRAGDPLIVLEAMKMEHIVRAPRDGEVAALFVGQGDQARHGSPLLELQGSHASRLET